MSKHKKLIIIGAGGHGRVCADVAMAMNCYDVIAFLDDTAPSPTFSYSYLGKTDLLSDLIFENDIFVAIGNSKIREHFISRLAMLNATIPTLIHPSSVISQSVTIGYGTVIMAGGIINNSTHIGNGVIINTSSSVDHDCIVSDYSHISVGSHLAGTVKIGKHTWIGAGATVINNVSICENCLIGAGAVVVKNINISGTYKGVPAKITT